MYSRSVSEDPTGGSEMLEISRKTVARRPVSLCLPGNPNISSSIDDSEVGGSSLRRNRSKRYRSKSPTSLAVPLSGGLFANKRSKSKSAMDLTALSKIEDEEDDGHSGRSTPGFNGKKKMNIKFSFNVKKNSNNKLKDSKVSV